MTKKKKRRKGGENGGARGDKDKNSGSDSESVDENEAMHRALSEKNTTKSWFLTKNTILRAILQGDINILNWRRP